MFGGLKAHDILRTWIPDTGAHQDGDFYILLAFLLTPTAKMYVAFLIRFHTFYHVNTVARVSQKISSRIRSKRQILFRDGSGEYTIK
jgi:hypothetical protein